MSCAVSRKPKPRSPEAYWLNEREKRPVWTQLTGVQVLICRSQSASGSLQSKPLKCSFHQSASPALWASTNPGVRSRSSSTRSFSFAPEKSTIAPGTTPK